MTMKCVWLILLSNVSDIYYIDTNVYDILY